MQKAGCLKESEFKNQINHSQTMNDLEIYKKAALVLGTGENIALVTVISTTGSTPGKVGYKMLVWGKKGETFGTVGGGSVEAEITNTAKNMLPVTESRVSRFNLDGIENDGKPLCGGSIEFLIESFDKQCLPLFKELSTVIENRGKGVLISIISPKKPPEKIFLKNVEQIGAAPNINLSPEVIQSIKRIVDKEQSAKKTLENGVDITVIRAIFSPLSRARAAFLYISRSFIVLE